jgi:hypothetical protein
MQGYTVYFIWKLLYMFRVVPPPIIRSANCIYSIWYLTPLLLSAAIVEELELVWVCCGWGNDLFLFWCGFGILKPADATTSKKKQISTPPTAHWNQLTQPHQNKNRSVPHPQHTQTGWCNHIKTKTDQYPTHTTLKPADATTSKQKQISTPPTAHSNQLQLFHDSDR